MPITEEERNKYATMAANNQCKCFKCDGIRNDTRQKCGPKPCNTCMEWNIGYWTSKMALELYSNDHKKTKQSYNTEKLVDEQYVGKLVEEYGDEMSQKHSNLTNSLVTELQSKGIVIDEEACILIAKKTNELLKLGFEFGAKVMIRGMLDSAKENNK